MSNKVLRLLAAFWLISASVAASAGESSSRREVPQAYRNGNVANSATVWYCASSGNFSVVCRLGRAVTQTSALQPVRNPNLPDMARQVIEEPGALSGGWVEIPLMAPPFDFELVGQLAEFVMCGNHDACGIIFGETLAQLEQLVRLHEARRLAGNQGSSRASAL